MLHWTTCKRAFYVKSYCFFETIAQRFKNYKLICFKGRNFCGIYFCGSFLTLNLRNHILQMIDKISKKLRKYDFFVKKIQNLSIFVDRRISLNFSEFAFADQQFFSDFVESNFTFKDKDKNIFLIPSKHYKTIKITLLILVKLNKTNIAQFVKIDTKNNFFIPLIKLFSFIIDNISSSPTPNKQYFDSSSSKSDYTNVDQVFVTVYYSSYCLCDFYLKSYTFSQFFYTIFHKLPIWLLSSLKAFNYPILHFHYFYCYSISQKKFNTKS